MTSLPLTVKEVVNRRARTRRHTELAIKSAARRLTLSDLSELLVRLDDLVCHVSDSDQLQVSDISAHSCYILLEVCKLYYRGMWWWYESYYAIAVSIL